MPLTDAQKDRHWNRFAGWGRVCQVNHWSMDQRRLDPRAVNGECSQWHKKVWAFAELLARQKHRVVMPDDLRKGAYMFALGTPKSLTKFDNGDLDRVLIIFRLLVEPDDLKAVKDWIAYESFDQAKLEIARCKRLGVPCSIQLPDDPGERRRQLYFLSQKPKEIVSKFCRDRFGGVQPEDMSLQQLRQLSMTLHNRRDYGSLRTATTRTEPVADEAEVPQDMIPF